MWALLLPLPDPQLIFHCVSPPPTRSVACGPVLRLRPAFRWDCKMLGLKVSTRARVPAVLRKLTDIESTCRYACSTGGQLGTGSLDTSFHTIPSDISGGLQFLDLAPSYLHQCGVLVNSSVGRSPPCAASWAAPAPTRLPAHLPSTPSPSPSVLNLLVRIPVAVCWGDNTYGRFLYAVFLQLYASCNQVCTLRRTTYFHDLLCAACRCFGHRRQCQSSDPHPRGRRSPLQTSGRASKLGLCSCDQR